MNSQRSILASSQGSVYIAFDDQFIFFDPASSELAFKSALEWDHTALQSTTDRSTSSLVIDSPFVLVPESLYSPGSDSLLLQDKYPYLTLSSSRYSVDTWTSNYAKCVYYIPDKYYNSGAQPFKHWLTCLAQYNQIFFDAHDTGIWALRMKSKIYVFVKVNRALKEVKVIHAPSPDDSTYHLLKIVESIKGHQNQMAIWTNENNKLHLSVLSQYLPHIVTTDMDLSLLIRDIISNTCV